MHPNSIVEAVASALGVDADVLRSRSRMQHVTQARQIAAYCLHRLRPDLSQQAIAAALGLRDHSTISYALTRAPTHLAALSASTRRRLLTLLPELAPAAPEPAPAPAPAPVRTLTPDERAMRYWAVQAQPSYLVATA